MVSKDLELMRPGSAGFASLETLGATDHMLRGGTVTEDQLKLVDGLVFRDPETGAEFGTIRVYEGASESPRRRHGWKVFADEWGVFADDDSGNAFLFSSRGEIAFWDHEKDELSVVAQTWDVFRQNCSAPEAAELRPDQVVSAWVDPELGKKLGIDVPPDGWIRRPND